MTFESVFPHIAEFLEPVDFLACMYVSRAARSVAGKKLNVLAVSAEHQIATQLSMLERWLEGPDFPFCVLIKEGFVFKRDAQFYQPKVVCSLQHRLLYSFVILKHDRTYQTELSQIAVFDPESSLLVAVYNFESNQFYKQSFAGGFYATVRGK